VRKTCITPSVLSSHSPPLPFTMPPIPEAPATSSLLSSIKSAFVQTIMMGTPDGLFVKVPGPRGSRVDDKVDVAGSGSLEGSAKCCRCDWTGNKEKRGQKVMPTAETQSLRRSLHSSRTTSISLEGSDPTHDSTQASQCCNSSMKVHGRVQSRTIMMRV
jgi:hypothetical protein